MPVKCFTSLFQNTKLFLILLKQLWKRLYNLCVKLKLSFCLDRRITRGEVNDPVKEKKPNPKIRDDLLIHLAEKKRQNIAALREKIVELEKLNLNKEVPARKPVKLTPNHIRRQRAKMGIVSNG